LSLKGSGIKKLLNAMNARDALLMLIVTAYLATYPLQKHLDELTPN